MSKVAKKWVELLTGVIIPAAMLGEKRARRVSIKEKVQLPAEYADHLVHERFAKITAAPKQLDADQSAADKAAADKATTDKAATDKAAADKATADKPDQNDLLAKS